MLTKDKDINTGILLKNDVKRDDFRALSSYLWLLRESPTPKLKNFHITITPFPLYVTLFSKSPYLTGHLEINYDIVCPGRFSKKAQRDIHDDRNIYVGAICGIS